MENISDKVVAFDTLFTTNHIQMLKILMSYVEPSRQKTMAVYIKFLELQYTLSFFKKHPHSSLSHHPKDDPPGTSKILEEILPFCTPDQQEQFRQIKNMMDTFENMQEMMETIQMMKELFPEGENPLNMDPSSLFSGNGGMDMSQMFEMFQTMQN